MSDFCLVRELPPEQQIEAAQVATEINPTNAPPIEQMQRGLPQHLAAEITQPQRIAVMTSKYWGTKGVKLTVGFMENVPASVKNRILAHLNAIGSGGTPKSNVVFTLTNDVQSADVRITIHGPEAQGFYSYLGTDIKQIPRNRATMSLQDFNDGTPESEYTRVVRHEGLHTCGAPHEHMRRAIIARLDVAKTISWGRRVLGWDEQTVRQQILTPIEESQLLTPTPTEDESIMTYRLPGEITVDGRPILGGADMTATDRIYLAKIYPLANGNGGGGGGGGNGGTASPCNGVLQALRVWNQARHAIQPFREGAMPQQVQFDAGEQRAIDMFRSSMTTTLAAAAALPWQKIGGIIGNICPQPGGGGGAGGFNCAALLAAIPQLVGIFCPAAGRAQDETSQ